MRLAIILALVPGCDRVFGLDGIDGIDGIADGRIDLCFGGSSVGAGGLLEVCLTATPGELLTYDGEISTGLQDTHECDQLVVQPAPVATEVCVRAARRIVIDQPLRGVGARPLVLVALDELVVSTTGAIDVSQRTGPPAAGTGRQGCPTTALHGASGVSNELGGGGGAGGSYGALGSAGGEGASGATSPSAGGMANAAPPLTLVAGGCPGGRGGLAFGGSAGQSGRGGREGGAIYLIAGTRITIAGTLDASGGGGGGGVISVSGAGGASGAGGGGSGGLIGLDAPTVAIEASAVIVANGGAGGGGAGEINGGSAGTTANLQTTFPFIARGGLPGVGGGGAGGDGGALMIGASSPSGATGSPGTEGGGAGGGGVGHIMIYAQDRMVDLDARISPTLRP